MAEIRAGEGVVGPVVPEVGQVVRLRSHPGLLGTLQGRRPAVGGLNPVPERWEVAVAGVHDKLLAEVVEEAGLSWNGVEFAPLTRESILPGATKVLWVDGEALRRDWRLALRTEVPWLDLRRCLSEVDSGVDQGSARASLEYQRLHNQWALASATDAKAVVYVSDLAWLADHWGMWAGWEDDLLTVSFDDGYLWGPEWTPVDELGPRAIDGADSTLHLAEGARADQNRSEARARPSSLKDMPPEKLVDSTLPGSIEDDIERIIRRDIQGRIGRALSADTLAEYEDALRGEIRALVDRVRLTPDLAADVAEKIEALTPPPAGTVVRLCEDLRPHGQHPDDEPLLPAGVEGRITDATEPGPTVGFVHFRPAESAAVYAVPVGHVEAIDPLTGVTARPRVEAQTREAEEVHASNQPKEPHPMRTDRERLIAVDDYPRPEDVPTHVIQFGAADPFYALVIGDDVYIRDHGSSTWSSAEVEADDPRLTPIEELRRAAAEVAIPTWHLSTGPAQTSSTDRVACCGRLVRDLTASDRIARPEAFEEARRRPEMVACDPPAAMCTTASVLVDDEEQFHVRMEITSAGVIDRVAVTPEMAYGYDRVWIEVGTWEFLADRVGEEWAIGREGQLGISALRRSRRWDGWPARIVSRLPRPLHAWGRYEVIGFPPPQGPTSGEVVAELRADEQALAKEVFEHRSEQLGQVFDLAAEMRAGALVRQSVARAVVDQVKALMGGGADDIPVVVADDDWVEMRAALLAAFGAEDGPDAPHIDGNEDLGGVAGIHYAHGQVNVSLWPASKATPWPAHDTAVGIVLGDAQLHPDSTLRHGRIGWKPAGENSANITYTSPEGDGPTFHPGVTLVEAEFAALPDSPRWVDSPGATLFHGVRPTVDDQFARMTPDPDLAMPVWHDETDPQTREAEKAHARAARCVAEGHWTTIFGDDDVAETVHDPDDGPCEYPDEAPVDRVHLLTNQATGETWCGSHRGGTTTLALATTTCPECLSEVHASNQPKEPPVTRPMRTLGDTDRERVERLLADAVDDDSLTMSERGEAQETLQRLQSRAVDPRLIDDEDLASYIGAEVAIDAGGRVTGTITAAIGSSWVVSYERDGLHVEMAIPAWDFATSGLPRLVDKAVRAQWRAAVVADALAAHDIVLRVAFRPSDSDRLDAVLGAYADPQDKPMDDGPVHIGDVLPDVAAQIALVGKVVAPVDIGEVGVVTEIDESVPLVRIRHDDPRAFGDGESHVPLEQFQAEWRAARLVEVRSGHLAVVTDHVAVHMVDESVAGRSAQKLSRLRKAALADDPDDLVEVAMVDLRWLVYEVAGVPAPAEVTAANRILATYVAEGELYLDPGEGLSIPKPEPRVTNAPTAGTPPDPVGFARRRSAPPPTLRKLSQKALADGWRYARRCADLLRRHR